MAQFSPRSQRGMELLVLPGHRPHESGITVAAGRQQRLERIKPGPIKVAHPIGRAE